ncbi:MAG: molybdopterin synthase catalytic subunit MoaE [Gammaproteobacteria bacterium]|nr:molybdopterin synthase catalytic subunit MoaE [Gammaproteobacteria bacterium]
MKPQVRIQPEDFDVSAEMLALRAATRGIGAVVNFVGVVRDENDARTVGAMTLEHYPGMTEKAITEIVLEAEDRWRILGATVIHRIGVLEPGDQIVLVAVASGHRGDAFQACEYIMDFLKTRAPFWKKESTPDGERWVAYRSSDDAAAKRWAQP